MAGGPSLLPYHAAFASEAARTGTELQRFMYDESVKLLRATFPRLSSGYLRKQLRQPRHECLILLSSSSSSSATASAAPSLSTKGRKPATTSAREVAVDGDDSDPLEVLDEESDDQVGAIVVLRCFFLLSPPLGARFVHRVA